MKESKQRKTEGGKGDRNRETDYKKYAEGWEAAFGKKKTSDTIINDECIKALKDIESESVDLTVTSPPYDKVRAYNDEWDVDFSKLSTELLRVTRDGGVAVIVIGDETKDFQKSLTSFKTAIEFVENGWKLFECCIYKRNGRPGAWWNTRFRVDHEYILIFFKGKRPKTFDKELLKIPTLHPGKKNTGSDRMTDGKIRKQKTSITNDTKCRGTVWEYNTSSTEKNKIKLQHPATFPDALVRDLIQCFSLEGDVVLDPFSGSGTTIVVANEMNRRYIGIEISMEYCQIIKQRMENNNE